MTTTTSTDPFCGWPSSASTSNVRAGDACPKGIGLFATKNLEDGATVMQIPLLAVALNRIDLSAVKQVPGYDKLDTETWVSHIHIIAACMVFYRKWGPVVATQTCPHLLQELFSQTRPPLPKSWVCKTVIDCTLKTDPNSRMYERLVQIRSLLASELLMKSTSGQESEPSLAYHDEGARILAQMADAQKAIGRDEEATLVLQFLDQAIPLLEHGGAFHLWSPIIAYMNHSCQPNCIILADLDLTPHTDVTGLIGRVQALRPILEGEELTIMYEVVPPNSKMSLRDFVHWHYGFICACTWCLVTNQPVKCSNKVCCPGGKRLHPADDFTMGNEDAQLSSKKRKKLRAKKNAQAKKQAAQEQAEEELQQAKEQQDALFAGLSKSARKNLKKRINQQYTTLVEPAPPASPSQELESSTGHQAKIRQPGDKDGVVAPSNTVAHALSPSPQKLESSAGHQAKVRHPSDKDSVVSPSNAVAHAPSPSLQQLESSAGHQAKVQLPRDKDSVVAPSNAVAHAPSPSPQKLESSAGHQAKVRQPRDKDGVVARSDAVAHAPSPSPQKLESSAGHQAKVRQPRDKDGVVARSDAVAHDPTPVSASTSLAIRDQESGNPNSSPSTVERSVAPAETQSGHSPVQMALLKSTEELSSVEANEPAHRADCFTRASSTGSLSHDGTRQKVASKQRSSLKRTDDTSRFDDDSAIGMSDATPCKRNLTRATGLETTPNQPMLPKDEFQERENHVVMDTFTVAEDSHRYAGDVLPTPEPEAPMLAANPSLPIADRAMIAQPSELEDAYNLPPGLDLMTGQEKPQESDDQNTPVMLQYEDSDTSVTVALCSDRTFSESQHDFTDEEDQLAAPESHHGPDVEISDHDHDSEGRVANGAEVALEVLPEEEVIYPAMGCLTDRRLYVGRDVPGEHKPGRYSSITQTHPSTTFLGVANGEITIIDPTVFPAWKFDRLFITNPVTAISDTTSELTTRQTENHTWWTRRFCSSRFRHMYNAQADKWVRACMILSRDNAYSNWYFHGRPQGLPQSYMVDYSGSTAPDVLRESGLSVENYDRASKQFRRSRWSDDEEYTCCDNWPVESCWSKDEGSSTTDKVKEYCPSTINDVDEYCPSTTSKVKEYCPSTTSKVKEYCPSTTDKVKEYCPSTTNDVDEYCPITTDKVDKYCPSTTDKVNEYRPAMNSETEVDSTIKGQDADELSSGLEEVTHSIDEVKSNPRMLMDVLIDSREIMAMDSVPWMAVLSELRDGLRRARERASNEMSNCLGHQSAEVKPVATAASTVTEADEQERLRFEYMADDCLW